MATVNVRPLGDRVLVQPIEEGEVKKGDKVLISKYGGTEIKIDDQTYLIMREDDILGIIG